MLKVAPIQYLGSGDSYYFFKFTSETNQKAEFQQDFIPSLKSICITYLSVNIDAFPPHSLLALPTEIIHNVHDFLIEKRGMQPKHSKLLHNHITQVTISTFTDAWASSILQFRLLKDLKILHQPSIDHISDMISDSAAEQFFHDMGTNLPLLESLEVDIPYLDVSWLRYLPSSLKRLDVKVSFEVEYEGPIHLNLQNLRELILYFERDSINPNIEQICCQLPTLINLVYLDLSANEYVRDPIIEYILSLSNLQDLDLSGTRVTQKGISQLNVLPRLRVIGAFSTSCTDNVTLDPRILLISERISESDFLHFINTESQMTTTILYFLSFYLSTPAFIALIENDIKNEEKFVAFVVLQMRKNLGYMELQLVCIHCVWGFVSMEKRYPDTNISHGPNEKNVRLFASFGGLQTLAKLMKMYQSCQEVLYSCVGLLTMVTCNDVTSQQELLALGCIEIISVGLKKYESSVQMVKFLFGALQQLSATDTGQKQILQHVGLPLIASAVFDHKKWFLMLRGLQIFHNLAGNKLITTISESEIRIIIAFLHVPIAEGVAEKQLNSLAMSTLCNASYWKSLNDILLSSNCIALIAKVYAFYRDREIRRSCIAAFANLVHNASHLHITLVGNKMIQILVNCLTAFDSEELKNMSAFTLCSLAQKGVQIPKQAFSLMSKLSFSASPTLFVEWEPVQPIVDFLSHDLVEVRTWAVNCVATLLLSDEEMRAKVKRCKKLKESLEAMQDMENEVSYVVSLCTKAIK